MALDIVPFSTSNRNPLVAIYGLPSAGSAMVLAPGQLSAEMRADIASNFARSSGADEKILLDGETYRFIYCLRRGVNENFEIGLELPFVMHRQGFLDSFIIGWHDTFGFPQGGRDRAPRKRLVYNYQKNGQTFLLLDQESAGFGDLRLTSAWRPKGLEKKALALRASLKFPTGDENRLHGSGSTDFALWLNGSEAFRQDSLVLFGAVGTLLMSDGEVLTDQQRNVVGFATLGGGWRALPWLAFKTQVDAHSPIYHSDLRELSGSMQLSVGGTLKLKSGSELDVGVVEDLVVRSAPDVVFHFAVRQTF